MKKIISKLISVTAAIIIIIGTTQNAYAATNILRAVPQSYYVDKNNIGGFGCNDAWAGTLQQPVCTITQGMSLLQAGDSLFVRGGGYSPFNITKSNVTISGYNNEMPLVSGGTGIKLIGTSHVTLHGFEVTGVTSTGSAGIFAEGLNNVFPTYNVIEYNKVHDNISNNTSGIMIADGSYNQILHNDIYNNYFSGIKLFVATNGTSSVGNEIGFNKTYNHTLSGGNSDGIDLNGTTLTDTYIHDNIIYGNSDDGLDTWNSPNNLIVGNIAYDQNGVGDGNGFKVGGGADGGHNIVKQNISYNNKARGFTSNNSGGNVYYNNVAYNNNYGFEDANKNSASTDPSTLINNIGYNNNMNFLAGPYTDVSHNNIWYSDNGRPKVSYNYNEYTSLLLFYQATGLDNPNGTLPSIQANPAFTDAPNHVFTLTAASPAINAGDPSNPAQMDAVGIVDIGAIESNLYPIVESISCTDPNPSKLSTVHFTIIFTEKVTGFDLSDLALIKDQGASLAAITGLSGTGNTYTVTVTVGAEDGSFHLNLIDNDSIKDASGTPLGQAGLGNGDFTSGETYLVDRISPTIISLIPAMSNVAPVAAVETKFIITFSENVFNVDVNDFILSTTGVSGAAISDISGEGSTRTITVTTGIGDGTVHLDAVDNDSITDIAANVLGGVGTGNYITTATYNIDKPNLAAPILRSPRDLMVSNLTTPTFWWSDIPFVTNYQLVIAKDRSFTTIVSTQTVVGTSFTVITPLINGTYYWRVRAITPTLQNGDWSTSRSFTVDITPPPVPVLATPTNNSSTRTTPTFKWRLSSTAVVYEFQYDDSSSFSSPNYDVEITKNLVTPPVMPKGIYYWRVRAKDAAGNWSAWSTTFKITIN